MASSSRSDVRYHQLAQEGDGGSAGTRRQRRNSVNRRNFTSRKRMLPKVVAIGIVFSILLLFQYGSHIFNSMTDDLEQEVEIENINMVKHDDNNIPKPPPVDSNVRNPSPPIVPVVPVVPEDGGVKNNEDSNINIKPPTDNINEPLDNNDFPSQDGDGDGGFDDDDLDMPPPPAIKPEPATNTNQSGPSTSKIPSKVIPDPEEDTNDNSVFQLNLEHCKIPELELKSKNYMNHEKFIPKLGTCDDKMETSFLKDGIVFLNYPEFSREDCCIQDILRPLELATDAYILGPCEKFNDANQLPMGSREFVQVTCIKSSNTSNTTYHNYHANIVPAKFENKIQFWKDKPKPINVMILVLDSTSRADGHRNLPKTMDLLNELNFVEFNGYHALNEPTMRNAIPLLIGVDEYEFYKSRSWTDIWDSEPFIWKKFSDIEYLTAYLEDMGHPGTFNYNHQKGFTKKPTDFYSRPLLVSYEDNEMNKQLQDKFLNGSYNGSKLDMDYCIGKKHIEEFILDYQLEILRKMNGQAPMFLMPWTCWPQHEYFGTLSHVDNATFDFFSQIRQSDLILENTLIILMGDHGFYTGDYAATHEGLLERRQPLFQIRLPKHLTDSHPEFLKNVQDNANVITSHYDVHATLEHLAQVLATFANSTSTKKANTTSPRESSFQNKHGHSLLLPIPKNRTCEEAGISKSRCACDLPPPLEDSTNVPENVKFEKSEPYVNRSISVTIAGNSSKV